MCELFDFWFLRSPSDPLNFDNNPATSVELIFMDPDSDVITECDQDCRVKMEILIRDLDNLISDFGDSNREC